MGRQRRAWLETYRQHLIDDKNQRVINRSWSDEVVGSGEEDFMKKESCGKGLIKS